ncbi:MAG: hypothetical protein Ct9H90mP30_4530 [Actinomycetota bacterium]|nr:MAG: hypothetical protein Ct9H90mP30_4530 [Actinomycetota bacterium]
MGDTGIITNENGTLKIENTTAMPSGHYLHAIEQISGVIKIEIPSQPRLIVRDG